MTSLSAPMKFRQCVALHWSRWIALLGEDRYSSSLALRIFKGYFHSLLWILKGKFHAQSTRCVEVYEILVRECAQNFFFFFYNSHHLGHLLALSKRRHVFPSCRCLCKVLRTVSFPILTKLHESRPENVRKSK